MEKIFYLILAFSSLFLSFNIKTLAQQNIAPDASALKTSYVSTWETLSAINDGYEPKNSGDKGPGAYGNWNTASNFNKWNWVEYDFNDFYLIDRSEVYWWTDGGGIQIPYDTYLKYFDVFTGEWEFPANVVGNGVAANQYNITTFSPVLTNKIRLYCISTAAQGILEWKVFGSVAENIPSKTTVAIDNNLDKGVSSMVTITAKDGSGNPVQGYAFNLQVNVINDIHLVNESYQINNQTITGDIPSLLINPTTANGVTTFNIELPQAIDPNDGLEVIVKLEGGIAEIARYSFFEPGMGSPVLIPDNTEITVDNPIEITYAENETWRQNITKVKINGIELNPTDFELSPGIIRLLPLSGNPVLTTSGSKQVVIEALGYENTEVVQLINAGRVSPLKSHIDSTVKIYRPSVTSLPVLALDSYGNPVPGYVFRYDIEYRNNTVTTTEEYFVENKSVRANSIGNSLAATNSEGKTFLKLKVPVGVDVNDGILFKLKLNDDVTVVGDSKGYTHDADEKIAYLPLEMKQHKEFSWDQTAQSENFTAFWGTKTGPDPLHPLAGNSFDPKTILDNLEQFYQFYIDSMKFILNPDTLNMRKYKFVVILFDTWKNGYTSTGSAYGGSVDGVIGAMWMSPMSGFVVAHEFGHACQAMIPIQYPGKGFKNKDDAHVVGMYWEACANYMAYLSTGQLGNVFSPLFINTAMLQYLSTIDYRQYEFIYLPAYIIDKYGIEALGKQWRNAEVGDNPFDAMMRGLNMTRDEMRREAGLWAMHNVRWDYSIGDQIRSYFYGLDESARTREYTFLEKIPGSNLFIVPREMAPADYGYNIIPVFPDNGASVITAKLSGYDNDPAKGGGWSYGFVAVDNAGNPRYGESVIETDENATLNIQPSDSLFYLVVLASPKQTNTYAWTPAWPKVYRFPYAVEFENVLPAGHKNGYNSMKNLIVGGTYANGGGWVAATARVDATAYVGPNAQVLGTAKVMGNARIEDFAVVNGSAQVKDYAIVRGNAIVGKAAVVANNAVVEKTARVYGGRISGNGVVTGSAAAVNCKISDNAVLKDVASLNGVTLSGNAIVGGDKTSFVSCSEGLYLSLNQSKCDARLWDTKVTADINQVVDEYYYPLGDIPQYPDNLQATAISGSSVLLTWDEALDNGSVVNYIVFQNGKPLHLATGVSDTITGLNPETEYVFTLRARDNAGNISEESEQVQVNTLVSFVHLESERFDFSLNPNPAFNDFSIITTGADNAELTIVNLLGEVVYKSKIENQVTLNRYAIEKSGIYFVKVQSGINVQVKKLVIR